MYESCWYGAYYVYKIAPTHLQIKTIEVPLDNVGYFEWRLLVQECDGTIGLKKLT